MGDASLQEDTTGAVAAAHGRLSSFAGFQVVEVLNEDPLTKSLAVLGRFPGSTDQAVLLLNRKPFDKAFLSEDQEQEAVQAASGEGPGAGGARVGLLGSRLLLTADFANDIYSKYVGHPPPEHSAITVDLIYPATDKHVAKHRAQKRIMITETPEMYERTVLPYIRAIPPARLQWVYNVLERKKEVERLIFEDSDPQLGFMLHPDLKWDQQAVDQLYCLALVHRRDLPCLRALDTEALPLLENVRDKGCKAIQERYGVPASQLRLFVHYQPSYYHLHVHFVHVSVASHGTSAGKAIVLDDVIDNIKTFGGDYWRRRTLTYTLGEADELWRLLAGGADA